MKKQKKIGVLRYGIGNINSFTNTLDKLNINYSSELLENFKFKENPDIIFNILIRTSERPDYFKKCMESIKKQTFSGKVNNHLYPLFLNL